MEHYFVNATLEMRVADRRGDEAILEGGMTPEELAVAEAENVLEELAEAECYAFSWYPAVPQVTGTYDGGTVVSVRVTGESREEFRDEDDAWEAAEEDLDHLGKVHVSSVEEM